MMHINVLLLLVAVFFSLVTTMFDVCIFKKISSENNSESTLPSEDKTISFDNFLTTFYKWTYVLCWIALILLKATLIYRIALFYPLAESLYTAVIWIFSELLACLSSIVYTRQFVYKIEKKSFYKLIWKTFVLSLFLIILDVNLLFSSQSIELFFKSPIISFFGIATFITYSETCAEIIGQIMDKDLEKINL